MTLITSTDAKVEGNKEPNLSIPFKPKPDKPLELDPASIPADFNSELADLLWKVKLAGVPLTGKIAEYAGFYLHGVDTLWDKTTNNGNEPDKKQLPVATANKQPNKSLDKLTFLIMFILPYKTKTPSAYFGDPLSGPQTTWSYLANQLRVGTLKKLNQAGEQVNKDEVPCDDTGAPLGNKYDTAAAYDYYTNADGKGFAHSITGAFAASLKSTPLFCYLTLSTEGGFLPDTQAFDIGYYNRKIRKVIQQPQNITGLPPDGSKPRPKLKKKVVRTGQYTGALFIPSSASANDYLGVLIQTEVATGRHYCVNKNVASDKRYVKLWLTQEDLSDEIFDLNGLKTTDALGADTNNTFHFSASYYTKPDFGFPRFGFGGPTDLQFDRLEVTAGQSGVTTAWGLDLGRWWKRHYYVIKFQILIFNDHAVQTPTVTGFALGYKYLGSTPNIPFTAQPDDLRTALLFLLGLNSKPWPSNKPETVPDTIVVNTITSTEPQYSTGWEVTIQRTQMEGVDTDGYHNMYSGNIFYLGDNPGEVDPNIKLLPTSEAQRFQINTPNGPTAWNEFTSFMNDFFGGVNWLDPSHFDPAATQQEINRFEELMKRSIGIKRGPAFLIPLNHRSLLAKFNLPSHELFYPRFIEHFMLPEYYDPILKSIPLDLVGRMNVAERFLMLAKAYSLGTKASDPILEEAIRRKSINKLIEHVGKYGANKARKDSYLVYIKNHFNKHLYRNVESD